MNCDSTGPVRISISFKRQQNVCNNIYICFMTSWSLITNLANVIKYVRTRMLLFLDKEMFVISNAVPFLRYTLFDLFVG